MPYLEGHRPDSALRIGVIYAVFASLWIWLSDSVLEWLFPDPAVLTEMQSAKGMLFVAVTALLLYQLVRRELRIRRTLDEHIRRERARLEHFIRVSPVVIYSVRADPGARGGFVVEYVSPRVKDVVGYSPAECYATPGLWFERVHPDDRERVRQAQRDLLETGTLRYEYRVQHVDGSWHWVYDQVVRTGSVDDGHAIYVGAGLDVTDLKRAERQLQASEQRYRNLFAANPVPLWVYDREDWRFLAVNAAAVAKYGYSEQEFLSMAIFDIRPPDEAQRLRERLQTLTGTKGPLRDAGLWRHRTKDGALLWVTINAHDLEFDGRPARMVLAQDVSDTVRAQEQMQLTAQVFDASQEGILISDADNRVISVNPAFTRITGYAAEEIVGHTPAMLASGRHEPAFYQQMWQALQSDGRWQGEVWNRRKNGGIYPEWLSISAIRAPDGRISHYIGMLLDLSSSRDAEEKIRFLSSYDALTRLPNRSLLEDRARQTFAAARRARTKVALMYLDLDRFKNINDSLGHAIGDLLLKELAARLARHMHQDDTICRPGGDEFIFLLPNTDDQRAVHVAQRILGLVSQPLEVGGQVLNLNASVGIAIFPDNGDDLARLSQCADIALSRAKQRGRGNFQFFTQQMHDRVYESLQVENDLRRALRQDELLLHYQLQVDAATLRPIGVEALVRWRHPERGLVPPARFIPIAEECGLIHEIGQWVLRTALRQTARWRAEGLRVVPVAVNLSMAQFRHAGLCDTVADALRESGLEPALLELELTESIAMEDSAFTLSQLDRLKALGVSLSIDDFGTGYSSLSYLKRFKIDKLKIDQSFVRDLHVDADDKAIVTGIVGLARNLGFRTIAEGVETGEQLEFLRQAGCDEIQGYYIARPLPAEDIARMLTGATPMPVEEPAPGLSPG